MNNEQFTQHQFQGSQRINLFGLPLNVNVIPDGTPFFDVRLDGVAIPARETTYFCTLTELPEIFRNKTHFILKYAPVITPTSLGHVHHMQVFLCEGMNFTGHSEVGVVRECDGIAAEISPCRSAGVLSGWAIGATDYALPEGVAFPIGGDDKIHTHVLFEMHYDNPGEIDGLIDSSGVRYFYTDETPEIRAGIFPVGYGVRAHMLIPPNVERYTVTAYCPMNCTNFFFPEGGITVYASLLHTHTVGAEVVLRHIRDGVELDPIDLNRNYDFNYQQINFIPRVQILPGDEMILECVYNSANRNVTTLGGEGSRDEMCFAYLHYYPATDLSYCVTLTHPAAYDEWANTYLPSDQRFAVYAAAANNISDVRPVFDSLNWTEESYREYERIGTTGEQLLFCYSASNFDGIINGRSQPIAVESPLEPSDKCVNAVDNSGSATPYGSVITVLLCWMAAAIVHSNI